MAITASGFRRMALSFREAYEGAHMGTADFRIGKRIFATLGYPDKEWGMVGLTPEQQQLSLWRCARRRSCRSRVGGDGRGART